MAKRTFDNAKIEYHNNQIPGDDVDREPPEWALPYILTPKPDRENTPTVRSAESAIVAQIEKWIEKGYVTEIASSTKEITKIGADGRPLSSDVTTHTTETRKPIPNWLQTLFAPGNNAAKEAVAALAWLAVEGRLDGDDQSLAMVFGTLGRSMHLLPNADWRDEVDRAAADFQRRKSLIDWRNRNGTETKEG